MEEKIWKVNKNRPVNSSFFPRSSYSAVGELLFPSCLVPVLSFTSSIWHQPRQPQIQVDQWTRALVTHAILLRIEETAGNIPTALDFGPGPFYWRADSA